MKKFILIIFLFPILNLKSQIVEDHLVSKMDGTLLLDDLSTYVNYWGFGQYIINSQNKPSFPGPLLTYKENDSVHLWLHNLSPEDHTIHLHGLDVSQAYDGVPTTSFAVNSQDSTVYKFLCTHPGTYLYHCHVLTTLHLSMGMYGMIVVHHAIPNLLYNNGPGFNKEYNYLFSDMYKQWNINPTSPGEFYDFNADYFMVNGLSSYQLLEDSSQLIQYNQGDSIALRLANVAYSKIKLIFPLGCNPTIYMSDGRVLPNHFSTDTLNIFPGERYSIVLNPDPGMLDSIDVSYFKLTTNEHIGQNFIGILENQSFSNFQENENISVPCIYPNPANEQLTIKSNSEQNLIIIDINGKIIVNKKLINGINKLNTSSLNNGAYMLYFVEERKTNKLIINQK